MFVQQVCDSEWHHLSLSVQFPSVTLYVDGVTFDPALIHDNGAIPNPAPRQRMFIGACWGEPLICLPIGYILMTDFLKC